MTRIGIPRSLLYYQYYLMWKTFFEELGAEVIVSPPTTAEIVASGCGRLSAEICLPVRVFCGHVIALTGKCDYIFIPSIHSVEAKVYNCPKFIGLPDLIGVNVPECPPILAPDIDINKGKLSLYLTIYKLGQRLTCHPLRIRKAAQKALKIHRQYRKQMQLQKLAPPQAIEQILHQPKELKNKSSAFDVTLALIGHPYLLYDEYVNHRLVTKLQRGKVNIVFPEMVSEIELRRSLSQMVERPYWTYEDEMIGAGGYYLQADVDGVISLAAFGCGPDSLMLDLLRRHAEKLNKPFLSLVLDEHTAETGITTRLEAFIDMIRHRKRMPYRSIYYIPSIQGETEEKIGTLGLFSLGNITAALKTVARMLNVPVVMSPLTKRTLSLGTRHSPEFVCLPFKVILGSFIESLERGADTLFLVSSTNACRLGYYSKVQEQILRHLGYEFKFLRFRSSQKGLVGVLRTIKNLVNDASWAKVIAAYRLGTAKLKALDDLERKVQQTRAVELEKGAADYVFDQAIRAIEEAPDITSVKEVVDRYSEKLNQIPNNSEITPLKVGIVGEIYVVMEPFVNMNLEKELGKLGVEVRRTRSTFASEWARLGSFNVLNEEKKKLKKFALPYLRRDVGGHGLESLAEKVRLSIEGYDGLVHLAPFTCMPEAVAGNIMPSTKENTPVLTILCDEQMAKAGFLTRLEAFVDLLRWRRKRLDSPAYTQTS